MSSRAWQSRDAWVLCALPRRGRGRDLSRVIGAFDALNHDVLPCADLEASLRRLGGAGLVKLGDRIALTREGRKIVSKGEGRGMIALAQSVEPVLAAEPPPTTLPDWEISEDAYDSAYKHYVGRMRKVG